MSRTYSLAYLTTHGIAPPDAITLAAEAGYQGVGIRIAPAAPGGAFAALIGDAALLRETTQRIADTGVGVLDVEIVRIAPDFNVANFKAFLDVCAAVGAKAILVAGDDPDDARMTDSFATFCAAAATYNLTADLEFMPWTHVRDCNTAHRIVENARQRNGGVLVDALHWARSTSTLADIKALPRGRLNYAQICDAPAGIPKTDAELIHTARYARLLPGEGGIDLVALFSALPKDVPVSVEIPNDACIPDVGVQTWARLALSATKAVIAAADKSTT
jgi:sugar phosphate isomerase/epimerase